MYSSSSILWAQLLTQRYVWCNHNSLWLIHIVILASLLFTTLVSPLMSHVPPPAYPNDHCLHSCTTSSQVLLISTNPSAIEWTTLELQFGSWKTCLWRRNKWPWMVNLCHEMWLFSYPRIVPIARTWIIILYFITFTPSFQCVSIHPLSIYLILVFSRFQLVHSLTASLLRGPMQTHSPSRPMSQRSWILSFTLSTPTRRSVSEKSSPMHQM
jgi:hypothetical protein